MTNVASLSDKAKSKNPVNVRVGKNVRYIMQERDVNQVHLAIELGLTESQVSRRITGTVEWTPSDIEKTARLLKVGVGRLFDLKLPGLEEHPSDYKATVSRTALPPRPTRLDRPRNRAGQTRPKGRNR